MSRAININATEQNVLRICADNGADITAIEPLRSGGTRVVLKTAAAAAAIRKVFAGKVLDRPVTRMPNRLTHENQTITMKS